MKKWMMGLGLAIAAAGCGYGQTRMEACPSTGCGNQYAATNAAPEKSTPVPPESSMPPDRTPAVEALPSTPNEGPLPDRAPPPVAPPTDAPIP